MQWERAEDLHSLRLDTVAQLLLQSGARSVLDLGCGHGELLLRLASQPCFTRVIGIDIDPDALVEARIALGLGLPDPSARLQVRYGSFEEADADLCGFDAAALVETIEHIDPARLGHVERAVFGRLRPRLVLVTTPNQDYNVLHGMPHGAMRHADHRFEWGRARFAQWSRRVAAQNGYSVSFGAIGPPDAILGSSTQMARFDREDLPAHG
ncbi:methyltransferase domain-containing protein [Thiomonas sp. FB-Cd]|uniref:methyltransferase domain-containing protein n=1 Tax=Thiomonas sp. FB-Cd TaxID=1158292 RepID=UPI0004DED745|nr:methyltransferase domain-containing protein [Thiomonas sp. FB-Cd]